MNKKDTNVKLKPRLVVAITSSLVITSTLLGCIKFILNTTSAPATEAALTRRRHLRGGGSW